MAIREQLLHEPEVSEITGFSKHTLRQWRTEKHRGQGPVWRKVGRSVVYLKSDVLAWMKSLEQPTPESNGG